MKLKNEEIKDSMISMLESQSNGLKVKKKFEYVIHEGLTTDSEEELKLYVAQRILMNSKVILNKIENLSIDELVIEELDLSKSEDFEGYVLKALITGTY